jgi:hypothetical protein
LPPMVARGRRVSGRRAAGEGEPGGGQTPLLGRWTGKGEGDLDAPGGDLDQRAELQQLQADRAAGRVGQRRVS